MRQLELLAPARDTEIGIAAIDCGADAVYIAGPQFGARQAAGNEIREIKRLCDYAHRFGARIFVTLNTILYDNELEAAYRQMLEVQDAGADAIIVQDMAIIKMAENGTGNFGSELKIPLHASTQCAIRTPEQAAFLESLGFSRLILERALSLEQIRAIRDAVSCELEFFVHGALCVCYSGQCYLSEHIAGRSANRGACIQACRSRYDLVDDTGKVLVRDKALLSLKDFNLHDRLEELADLGISSFKIEGRLKNISYVRNIVRYYSTALDSLVERYPDRYVRGSFGKVRGGFAPDPDKTFNRGYTELYMDGKRSQWAAMDAAKSMGEFIGNVSSVSRDKTSVTIKPAKKGISLNNGDGFCFIDRGGNVTGFRGDVCKEDKITSKPVEGLYPGVGIYRNINAAFERELERQLCKREIGVDISIHISAEEGGWRITADSMTEDGRSISKTYKYEGDHARSRERMEEMIGSQLNKTSGIYSFRFCGLSCTDALPFMSASFLNNIRRDAAEHLDNIPCIKRDILKKEPGVRAGSVLPCKDVSYKTNISNNLSFDLYKATGAENLERAYELAPIHTAELMRTRYCIRHELGICPVHHHAKNLRPLFLLNNGRRFALHFDCSKCEMTVTLP